MLLVVLLAVASSLLLLPQGVVGAEEGPCGGSDASTTTTTTTTTRRRKYDAATFFETTSFGLGNYAGYSFREEEASSSTTSDEDEEVDGGGGGSNSPSLLSLLLTSDETGVFNVYSQSLDGVFDGTSATATTTESDDGDTTTTSIPTLLLPDRVPLTDSTTDATFGVSYFPNGDSRILFTRDQGGNELSHVYLRSEDGQSVVDLTPTNDTRAIFAGWYKQNSVFMILTNERDSRYFDIYEYPVQQEVVVVGDGSTASNNYLDNRRMIYQNDLGYSIDAISSSGRYIVMTQLSTSSNNDLYLVDLLLEEEVNTEAGGGGGGSNYTSAVQHISEHDGNVYHTIHGFTVDETSLIYGTDEYGEYTQAWTYNLESGEKTLFAKDDNWDVVYVTQSFTGRYVVVGINADAQLVVNITDTTTGQRVELPPGLPPGELLNIRFSQNEVYMAFIINSDTSPSNIFVMNLETQTFVKVTNALSPKICQEDLVESEVIRYPSFDNLLIPSILYQPHGASPTNKVPALVYVHGGPGGQSTKGYSETIQHLVNHGFAILAANNRGSSGYGKTFFHLDDKKHGEVDLQDIVYGRTYLESLDWIDSTKIGIIGGSYGGYMVVAALAFEPTVFDVGINIFGVTNWLRVLQDIPPWWEAARQELYDELGDPAFEEERLRRISPLFHANNITKPMLVVQGANDPRVPQVESDEIVQALKYNGVPVVYLLFDDEGHGFYKKENRIEASEAYLSFLNKYLVKDQSPTESFDSVDGPDDSNDSSSMITALKVWRLITSITVVVTVFQFLFV